MKRFFTAVMMLVLVISIFVACSYIETHYNREANVIGIEEETSIIIEDTKGNIWIWEKEDGETFEVGEAVTLVMNNNHTDNNIKDDIIERIF